ncbi:MAG: DegT/DnrJ/EryC1/StrS family aminotransferase [Eubacteriales bacterium]
MNIMPNNLQRQYDLHGQEYEEAALRVLRSGWYVLGEEVASFEREFAQYLGAKHCVGVASGLDALWMSFRLLEIGEGDEVIVCSNAYIACVMGITMNGNHATPIFVEPDEYDNIDASKIIDAITEKTKAILVVHLYGQACNMEQIMHIAEEYQLRVVEDCAQSHGNHFQGQKVGTFGDVACFSFYPSKGCGAFGDGGAIVTNCDELAQKMRVFRNYGSQERYCNEVVGTNSRLDELQAALLRVKLSHLDELNAERNEIACKYNEKITSPCCMKPRIREGADSSYHQYVVHVTHGKRDAMAAYLREHGIGTIIHYPIPPHLSQAYAYLGYKRGDFPIGERCAKEVLSLPIYNGMLEEEQEYVIQQINGFEG